MRLLLVLFLLLPAAAQDLLTPGEQVQRALRRAVAERDEARATALLAELGELFRYPASAREANDLLKLAAETARNPHQGIAVAAIRALGATHAPRAAAHIEPFLRTLKPAAGEEAVMVAAVQAAGRLRVPALVTPLLKLAKGSPDNTIAERAFFALGEFCKSDAAQRKSVTNRTLDIVQQVSRRRSRWRRMRAPALRALQRLIGRRMNTVVQFTDYWKTVKDKKDPF